MKIVKLTSGGLLGFVFAAACGGMSGHSGGSNTNWFESCTSSAECRGGLECWCGICTQACATDCSASAAGATCSEPPPSCADPSKKPACAVPCTKDADCRGLGSGASCVDGICGKGTQPAKDSGTALTCDARANDVLAKTAAIAAAADHSCQTAADCVDSPRIRCEGGCGGDLVSKGALDAITSQLSALEQELCVPFDAAGCQVLIPPCVFPGDAACVAGVCQRALPGGSVDSGAASCSSMVAEIRDRLTAAIDAADTSCTQPGDCFWTSPIVSGTDTACFSECSVSAVSLAGAASIALTRGDVQRDLCAALQGMGCSPVDPPCVLLPPGEPACVAGKCQGLFPPIGDDAGAWCADRTAQFKAQVEYAVRLADPTCTQSSDCTTVQLANGCYESCTYAPESKDGAQTINDTLTAMDQTWCPHFTGAGCTVQRLPCPAPMGATCQGGKCVLP